LNASKKELVEIVDQLAIIGYDSVYFQYQQGLLDEELWNELLNGMKRSMTSEQLTTEDDD